MAYRRTVLKLGVELGSGRVLVARPGRLTTPVPFGRLGKDPHSGLPPSCAFRRISEAASG